MGRVTARRPVVRIAGGQRTRRPDTVTVEEPMEIRVDGKPLTVTMRTPGNDFDLTMGFLVAEGVISAADQVRSIRYCAGADADGRQTYNVVDVALTPGVVVPSSAERHFLTTSACGVCGKASLEAVDAMCRGGSSASDTVTVAPDVLAGLPATLRAAQRVFDSTGGLHAAGLFSADGSLLGVREDVGRHNAVDKVVGDAVRSGRLPLRGTILLVSGRASFELVQKAVMAGIPVLAAVSAPSSLAVDLAADRGMTLVGFLRGASMNVYTGAERMSGSVASHAG